MQVLNLTERAHFKKAYNYLALTKHPDKGGDPAEFKIIQQAKDFFEAQAEQEKELMAERERELSERRRVEEDALWEAEFEKCRKKRADEAAHKECPKKKNKKRKKRKKKKKKEKDEDDEVSGEDYTSLYFPGKTDGRKRGIRTGFTGARRMSCPWPDEYQTIGGGAATQANETRSD